MSPYIWINFQSTYIKDLKSNIMKSYHRLRSFELLNFEVSYCHKTWFEEMDGKK